MLDSSSQKSKIAVKNPQVRPPKDHRSLLHMPSLNPTPPSNPPAKKPVGFPVGGLGIGIKLPGRSFVTNRKSAESLFNIYISMFENDDTFFFLFVFFSGLSGGLPVLKKTQPKVRDVNFPNVTHLFQRGEYFKYIF